MDFSDVQSRDAMLDWLENVAVGTVSGLANADLSRPLIKTRLIELVDSQQELTWDRIDDIFRAESYALRSIGEGIAALSRFGAPIGFLERFGSRFLAIYTHLDVEELRRNLGSISRDRPEFDRVWISGATFGELWKIIVHMSEKDRYTRLVFEHESIFQGEGGPTLKIGHGPRPTIDPERRLASFRLADRIEAIDLRLQKFQTLYNPLYAISQVRFPSPLGHGGHDLWSDGSMTNRSTSFRDHRAHVQYVVSLYDRLLYQTEEIAWTTQDSVRPKGSGETKVGAPIVFEFTEPGLDEHVFHRWIKSTFESPRGNRFRLWGKPIDMGRRKVHVNALDRHLWQPLFLELTPERCFLLLPNGSCGNIVHRLLTNIQRYLDPGAKAFIGNVSYSKLVGDAAREVNYGPIK